MGVRDRDIKCEGKKLRSLTDVQKNIMEMFNCKYLGGGGYLKSIGAKRVWNRLERWEGSLVAV